MSKQKKNIKNAGRNTLYRKDVETCLTGRRVIPLTEKENIDKAIDKIVEPYKNNN